MNNYTPFDDEVYKVTLDKREKGFLTSWVNEYSYEWHRFISSDWLTNIEYIPLTYEVTVLTQEHDEYDFRIRIFDQDDNLVSTYDQDNNTLLNDQKFEYATEDGDCCSPPNSLTVVDLGKNSATLDWDDVSGANNYEIAIREVGGDWMTYTSNISSLYLDNLDCETTYEYTVATACSSVSSRYSEEYVFTTKDCPVLTSITISGPTSVNENSTANYICTANYSDGSSQDVTSDATWGNTSYYATIHAGVLTTKPVDSNENSTITVYYGGEFNSYDITIKKVAPTLSSISISDISSVNENSSVSFFCIAKYSDNSTEDVTNLTTWELNSTTYASITNGVLTTKSVNSDTNCIITASYENESVSKNIVIKNTEDIETCSSPVFVGRNTKDITTSSATIVCYSTTGSGGNLKYNWYLSPTCSGTLIATTSESELTVYEEGTYSCKVYVEDFENSCFDCYSDINVDFPDCDAPIGLNAQIISCESAKLTWDEIQNSAGYIVLWGKSDGSLPENRINTSTNYCHINNLEAETEYYFTVYNECLNGTENPYADIYYFTTPKCEDIGSLKVTISPTEAVNAGAQWKVDDRDWKNSGDTESVLSVGNHTVSFKTISGWSTPSNKTVSISANQTISATGAYTVVSGSDNTKPNKPVIVAPEYNESISLPFDLTWICTDIDGDELRYIVYGRSVDSVDWEYWGNAAFNTLYLNFLEVGDYYCTVAARDNEEWGPYSDVHRFTVASVPSDSTNTKPNKPVLVSPSNGESVSLPISFSWVCNDRENDDLTYTMYKGASPENMVEWTHGIDRSNFTVSGKDLIGSWYWRIRAYDGELWSDYSDTYQFTGLSDNNPPNVPNLIAPSNESTVSPPFELKWDATDDDNDNLSYKIYLGINSSNVSEWKTSDSDSYTVSNLSPGTYYWGVQSYDGTWWSGYSGSYKFVVSATLESITISGSPNVDENSSANYTCTANYSDGSSQNVTNSTTWSENSDYASINSSGVLTANSVNSDQSCTITANYGGKSDIHNITIKNIVNTNHPPNKPVIVSPENGTVFKVGDEHTYEAYGTDDDGDNLDFYFYLTYNSGDWSLFNGSTSYITPVTTFTAAGTFQIKVQTVDPFGAKSEFSEVTEFSVEWPTSTNYLKFGKDITFYPNPANEKVIVNMKQLDYSNFWIKIYSIQGTLLLKKKVEAGITELNVKNFKTGVYLLSVENNNNIGIEKLIIE